MACTHVENGVGADVVPISFDHDPTAGCASSPHRRLRFPTAVEHHIVVNASVESAVISADTLLALVMNPVMMPVFAAVVHAAA